jgi:DNA uptake protein ComE-like DNA-binding protein
MNKPQWKDYFYFSQSDRRRVTILLTLMGAFIVLTYLFPPQQKPVTVNKELQQQLAMLEQSNPSANSDDTNTIAAANQTNKNYAGATTATPKDSLFYFDPNTLDENGWRLLGVRDKTIHTIINYRNAGAKFYKPEDIRKIYGLYKEKADELIPFIKIKEPEKISYKKEGAKKDSAVASSQTHHSKTFSYININTATADDFKTLPGIGDVLSARIVRFRASIGGFKSIDDLAKTYGLRDSVFQTLRPYLVLK